MADKNDKVSGNINGPFYVDANCIACRLCVDTADTCFKMTADDSLAFVYKQPQTDEEKILCSEAMESCPVEAIGNNG